MFERLRHRLIALSAVRFLKFRLFPSLKVFRYTRMIGIQAGVSFSFALLFRKAVIRIALPGFKAPLAVRPGTSDIGAFNKVLVRGEYDVPLEIHPKLIIDGGANVGYSSVFFANRYPEARIIAVEPEESNYELLKENTAAYPQVEPLKGAIWHRETTLNLKGLPMDSKWGFKVEESDAAGDKVESFVIDKLSGGGQIGILKLDIEGAEKEVFSWDSEIWLGKVDVIMIELHDYCKPGCAESVHSAVEGYGFNEFRKGENLVLVRKSVPLESEAEDLGPCHD